MNLEEKQTEIEDEINLLDYLIVLAKHKGLIIKITLGTAILAAIISLLLPKIYKAETRILPPQQSSSMASQMLSQMAGGLAGMAGGMLGISNPNEMYVGMIQGRTVSDSMISRFNLKERYRSLISKAFNGEVVLEDIREKLSDRVDVSADSKSNIITISVEEEDPKIAADMANAFVDEFKKLSKGLAVTEAAQRKLFFEEQVNDTKFALTKAEDELKKFSEKTGVLQPDAQAQAVIAGDATLRAQIAATEVQIKVTRTYSTPNNPDLQQLEEILAGLKAQLSKIEGKGGAGPDPLMPTGRMPSIGTEYIRKLRDIKLN